MISGSIGHYSVERMLGAGGMGEVYRAVDTALRRPVALKILPAGQTDSERRRRFVQEAQSASALNHPNIVTIYEIGAEGELDFIAMELVEGRTLADQAGGKPLPIVQALRYAEQIADGLAAAHAVGIVHRDLKPANVMVTPRGLVKILDFGLAKLVESVSEGSEESPTQSMQLSTEAGRVVGTVSYMSPEQAEGRKVDARSDVFAFGCVLYEMLTGFRPFRGSSPVATLGSILRDEPAPAGTLAPLPRELERIVWRCLRKDPDKRFQHMADVRVLLAELLEDAEAGRLTLGASGTAPAARGSRIALVTAALLGLALGAGGTWALRRAPAAEPADSRLVTRRLTTRGGYNGMAALSPDRRSIAYASDRTGALEIYVSGLTPGSRELALTNDGSQNMQPEWSTDGQWLAYHSRTKGGIWIVPSAGGTTRQVADFGSDPAWSPDGERLVFTSDVGGQAAQSVLWTVRRDGSDRKPLTKLGEPGGGHRQPSWSHDGKHVVFAVGQGGRSNEMYVVSLESGRLSRIDLRGSARDPRFSLRDDELLWADNSLEQAGLWRMPIDPKSATPRGPATLVLPVGDGFFEGFSIAQDGTLAISLASEDANLWAVDLGKGVAREPVRLSDDAVRNTHPDYSQDARVAYMQRVPGRSAAAWVMNQDGSGREPIFTEEPVEWPQWTRDGSRLLVRRGPDPKSEYALLDMATRRLSPLPFRATDMLSARLSPDGKELAYHKIQQDGALNIWTRPLDGGEPKQVTFDKGAASYPTWSPDGRWLAFEHGQGHTQAAVVSRDGGRVEVLTSGPGQNWTRSWSPDGEWLAAACERDSVWNVARIHRRTRALEWLTRFRSANGYVRYPVWSPRGDRIVFERNLVTSSVWISERARAGGS